MPFCQKCGAEIEETGMYCPGCGSKQKRAVKNIKESGGLKKMGKKQVNWTLTLIMSILFGSIGVDRFIMGHVGLGILKLLTFGGCGVWWLIDVILIATKHPFQDIEWVQ